MSGKDDEKLSPEIADKFLDIQKEDIEVRKQELELRKQENKNSHEYSLAALEAQKELYRKTPSERRTDWWHKAGIALVFVVVTIVSIGVLFYHGEDELATELIKVIVTTILAGGAGYGFGYNKGRKYEKQEQEDGS